MKPFSFAFSRMIGRQEFDKAIDHLSTHLKENPSDVSALKMIAHCHDWAGRPDEAVTACHQALHRDAKSFEMHAMLAQLLAKKGEHNTAAIHAQRGLDYFPEAPEAITWLPSLGAQGV